MDFLLPNPWPAANVAARAHAESEYPKEAVGGVLVSGEYVPFPNIAPDPTQGFEVPGAVMDLYHGELAALVHSHPLTQAEIIVRDGPLLFGPSEHDMAQQMAMALPWGLVVCVEGKAEDPVWWGDELPTPGLIGRPFIHGIYDCYSLIRDYYRIEGIALPDCARGWAWWEGADKKNLYMDNFARAGFVRVPPEDVLPGDLFLAQIGADVVNHAGVVVGNGLILQHLRRELSRRTPLGHFRQYVTAWLHYTGPGA